jgi:Domain of unknown function (DUF5916)
VPSLIPFYAAALLGTASVAAAQQLGAPPDTVAPPVAPHPAPVGAPQPGQPTTVVGPRATGAVYDGRAHHLDVQVPRVAEDIEIDGTLKAPVWRQAALLTGFSEYFPVDGRAASDSTEVYVWYSPRAIYFGIRAFEPHGPVHATLANRDQIDGDDNVEIVLTPFVHGRHAILFGVNPFGVQEDGTITEGVLAGGYNAAATGPPPVDLSADYVYESKGRLTPYGYEVTMRIPFRSLKFQRRDPQNWGINIIRNVQHSSQMDTWVPTRIAAASFLAQSGTLVGLTGLQPGLVLDLNPIVTEKALGAAPVTVGPGWEYGVERPQLGGNVRYGITNNLVLDGTFRPDFAEVESDATQLQYDPRQAVQYPEKRPFFLDGIDQFSVPNNLIYTRDIIAPIGAAKLTGNVGDFNVAYLGALDDEGNPFAAGSGHPLFNVLRTLTNVGEASQIGVTLTDKEDGGSFNRVAGIDSRFTWDKIYSLALQGAGSFWRANTPYINDTLPASTSNGAGPLWDAHFVRAGRSVLLNYDINGIDPEWDPGAGFVSRAGVTNLTSDNRYTFYFRPGGFVQTFSPDFTFQNIWTYRNFTDGGPTEDRKFHFSGFTTLFGGWQLEGAIFLEHFGYDPQLYQYYYLGHISGRDTSFTHFVGTSTIPNTDCVLAIQTPAFAHFDVRLNYITCRDENFYEWASANINDQSVTLDWRPTNQIRAQFTYNAQTYRRHSDNSLVASTRIPRLDIEYQLSRPIFFRLVGQYDAVYTDNLRDASRTDLPIFIQDPYTDIIARAVRTTSDTMEVQGLFAYQPVPGTVVFVGYGNNLSEPVAFHFVTLTRRSDSFFVKFSYLFRM